MRINTLLKNFKIKLIFLFLIILLLIFAISPKKDFKENLAQNFRIYTCQPNFTNHDDSQLFKIKRIINGAINYFKKGCEYEELKIHINFNNFSKIKKDRLKALQEKVLINPRKVTATILHNNKKFRARVRLKGDLSNHWGLNKQWSLRIELKDGKSINGMKEFSITKIKERAFPENLIIGNQFSRMGLISPNFKIYKTNINGNNWGLMIAEEQFSNVFLENRKLKESLIFKLTNDVDFKMTKFKNISDNEKENFLFKKQGKIEVDIYNKKKINSQNYLRNHESLIKSINLIINSEYSNAEKLIFLKDYFNVEKFGKLLANVIFYNSFHSLHLNNLRFYLNPYNLKIEPIPTDNLYGKPSKSVNNYKNTLNNLNRVLKIFVNDKDFLKAYKNSLNQIQFDLKEMKIDSVNLCKKFEEYCQSKINFKELEKHIINLIKTGEQLFLDLNLSSDIKNQENIPSLTLEELKILKKFNTYIYPRLFDNYIKIYNLTSNDIHIKNIDLYFNKEETLGCKIFEKKNCNNEIYKLDHDLKRASDTFSYEKIKLDLNRKQNLVWGIIEGNIEEQNFTHLIKFENKEFNVNYFTDKNKSYNNLLTDPKDKTFVITGKYFVDKPIEVPKNYNLQIKSGSELIFDKDAYIYLNQGKLILDGSEKEIVLRPKDHTWRGIYVNNAAELSLINNTRIDSVQNFQHEGINLTGGVNFYKSDVEIINTKITNNRCEDALNIINSKFKIMNLEINNAFSDGIDSDFSNGVIIDSLFKNIGGDAIDTSGSIVSIVDTKIYNARDKGLSAGENSRINIEKLEIDSSTFGLVSKDLSVIEGKKIQIFNSTKFDVTAFEKKNHFGSGYINITDVELNNKILSQVGSEVIINNELIKSENFDIKDFY